MIRRAPTHHKGRPVRLETLDTRLPEKPDYALVWAEVLSKKGDGRWYRMRTAWSGDMKAMARIKALQRLHKGIGKRMWIEGWTAEELTLKVTEIDGLVFRWVRREVDELDELTAERVAERRLARKMMEMSSKAKEKRKVTTEPNE